MPVTLLEPCSGNKKDEVLRYIAHLASRITLGEASPGQVNWRYIRDQTMMALAAEELGPRLPPAGR